MCVCVYIYIYICIYIDVCMYTYTYTYTIIHINCNIYLYLFRSQQAVTVRVAQTESDVGQAVEQLRHKTHAGRHLVKRATGHTHTHRQRTTPDLVRKGTPVGEYRGQCVPYQCT